ncbi:PREDICTED: uncharacterized protein LOC105453663 isoform X1 [Wasmannia auropunctata]|uniref:uncharacterized protein LOC105453663 isoform X1 n=1 Tax=Wasmannia auropunctata TaxID=64793 RepID=UPI0005EDDFD6|nr:PREDICTED: uncharacterized protein LOC105453663 isoform X1 [Wasmannia auropunctata]
MYNQEVRVRYGRWPVSRSGEGYFGGGGDADKLSAHCATLRTPTHGDAGRRRCHTRASGLSALCFQQGNNTCKISRDERQELHTLENRILGAACDIKIYSSRQYKNGIVNNREPSRFMFFNTLLFR